MRMSVAGRILVADDEVAVCRILKRFLESKGYEVREAYDGQQCIDAYRQERADIVLMDVRMPGKDGLAALREITALDPEVKVIIITAVHEEELAQEILTQGAIDFITKPIDPNYLEAVLMQKIEAIKDDTED